MTVMWPWRKNTLPDEIARVYSDVEQARAERFSAEARRAHAHRLAGEADEITKRLRTEIDLNGFTELLQKAMRPR